LIRPQIAADPSGATMHQSDLPQIGQGLSRLTRCIFSWDMTHLLEKAEIDLETQELIDHAQNAGPLGVSEVRVLKAEHESSQDFIDSSCLQ
jgi:hypothetical protein